MWNDAFNMPKDFFLGGFLGVFTIGIIILAIVFLIALYVYHSLVWYQIGKKQKYKYPWLAWIPFANISMILEMGSFNWAWIFLILIPVIGWIAVFVLAITSMWRIFEKENYPGWFSISLVIPKVGGILYLIVIGFVAWGKGMKSEKKNYKKRK